MNTATKTAAANKKKMDDLTVGLCAPWHTPLRVPVPTSVQLPDAAIASGLLPSSASSTACARGRSRAPVPIVPLPLPADRAVSGAT